MLVHHSKPPSELTKNTFSKSDEDILSILVEGNRGCNEVKMEGLPLPNLQLINNFAENCIFKECFELYHSAVGADEKSEKNERDSVLACCG